MPNCLLDFQLPLNIFVMRLIMNLYVLVTLSCSVLLKAQIGSTSVDNFPVYQDTTTGKTYIEISELLPLKKR